MTTNISTAYSNPSDAYANYTQAECFAVNATQSEVACLSQHLDLTNPPSEYSYQNFTQLWEPIYCYLWNVTLTNRVDVEGAFNYCSVPLRGYDAFLFASLALLATAILSGKLAAVWALVAGGILGSINYYVNLLEISNSIALWLSVQPADLFFYAFLPPLLLDEALHLDFFLFRKIWVHSVLLAFVMVVLSALALSPLILFALGFSNRGWSWVHCALFSAIIAPTDALAVAAILAHTNGPERVVTLVQAESLLNDASGITLYLIFSSIVFSKSGEANPVWPSVWSVVPDVLLDTVRLAAVGIGIGYAMSFITGQLLRWLRWRGSRPVVETIVVLTMAYLSFYVTNAPAQGSGVIAVVVYGLYGNATSKWGMLADAEESGAFDATMEAVSFASNALVFFWSGVASVNYAIRSVTLLSRSAWSYAAIPLIYIFMLGIRLGCVAFFNIFFKTLGEGLSLAEVCFVGWVGLRGGVSLILTSAFTTGSLLTLNAYADARDANNTNLPTETIKSFESQAAVNADISLWTATFVLLTLGINGAGIAPLLRLLRLDTVPPEKVNMRSRAKQALFNFTNQQIASLREDANELLRGADWEAVQQYVDMSDALKDFGGKDDALRDSSNVGEDMGAKSGIKRIALNTVAALYHTLTRIVAKAWDYIVYCRCCTKTTSRYGAKALQTTDTNTKMEAGVSGGSPGESHEEDSFDPGRGLAGTGSNRRGQTRSSAKEYASQPHLAIPTMQMRHRRLSASSPALRGSASFESNNDMMGLVRHEEEDKEDGEGQGSQHDAWSDVSASELVEELGQEVPFFNDVGRTAAVVDRMYHARGARHDDGAETEQNRSRKGDLDQNWSTDLHDGDIEAGIIRSATPVTFSTTRQQPSASTQFGIQSSSMPVSASRPVSEGARVQQPLPPDGDDEQQHVISSRKPAGAKLLSELRRTLTAQPTENPEYYATVPAVMGASLHQRFAESLAEHPNEGSTGGEEIQVDVTQSDADGGTQAGRFGDHGVDRSAVKEPFPSDISKEPLPTITEAAGVSAGADEEHSGGYYWSLPAIGRQKLQQQLQQEILDDQSASTAIGHRALGEHADDGGAQATSDNPPDRIPIAAAAAAAPPPDATKGSTAVAASGASSLSASERRQLARALQRQLRGNAGTALDASSPRVPSTAISSNIASLATTQDQQRQQQQGEVFSTKPLADLPTAATGTGTSRTQTSVQRLPSRLQRSGASDSSSSSASVSQREALTRSAAALASSSSRHDHARSASEIPLPLPDTSWEAHHATLSGVAGETLQQELRRQRWLHHQREGGEEAPAEQTLPVTHEVRKDLLGRKMTRKGSMPAWFTQGQVDHKRKQPKAGPLATAPLSPSRRMAGAAGTSNGMWRTSTSGVFGTAVQRQLPLRAVLPAEIPISAALAEHGSYLHQARSNQRAAGQPPQPLPSPASQSAAATAAARTTAAGVVPSSASSAQAMTMPAQPRAQQGPASATMPSSLPLPVRASMHASSRHGGGPYMMLRGHGRLHTADKEAPLGRPVTLLERTYRLGDHDADAKSTEFARTLPAPADGTHSRNQSQTLTAHEEELPSPASIATVSTPIDSRNVDPSSAQYFVSTATEATETPALAHKDTRDVVDGAASLKTRESALLAEMRTRLGAGLKRQFVAKRLAGLLSVDGLRILQYACDRAFDNHGAESELHIWSWLEREICGGWVTRMVSRLSIWTTLFYRSMPKFLQTLFSWPFKQFAGLLRRHLGQRMLIACEVAVEYYLALVGSPQILWLQAQADGKSWALLQEADAEAGAAHRFIIAREIEAPDRFHAIQSYRAAMALLQQQMQFVNELFEAGLVDAREKECMTAPVERRLRRLEIVGPVWRPPRPKAVLRGLPFMACLPTEEFRRIWLGGTVAELRPGQCFWAATNEVRATQGRSGPGGFVVLSGIVRRVYEGPEGQHREYYQGVGGVIGVLLCMTGTRLPGTELAIAEGNALGKGPLVFHVPQALAQRIVDEADTGDYPHVLVLYEGLLRLAATYVVESMQDDVIQAVSDHVIAVVRREESQGIEAPGGGGGRSRPATATRTGAGATASPRGSFDDATMAALRSEGAPMSSRLTSMAIDKHNLPHVRSVSSTIGAMMQHIAALQEEADHNGGGHRYDEKDVGDVRAKNPESARTDHQTENVFQDPDAVTATAGVVRPTLQGDGDGDVTGMLLAPKDGSGAPQSIDGMDIAPGMVAWSASRGRTPEAAPRGTAMEREGGTATPPMETKAPDAASRRRHTTSAAQQQRDLATQSAPQLAADVLQDVRRRVPFASVVKVAAGTFVTQESHVILLAGSLRRCSFTTTTTTANADGEDPRTASLRKTRDDGSKEPRRVAMASPLPCPEIEDEDASAVDNAARGCWIDSPRVLPWLWESSQVCNLCSTVAMEKGEQWVSGPQGATMVVCGLADGSIPSIVRQWKAEQEAEQLRKAIEVTKNGFNQRASSSSSSPSGVGSFPIPLEGSEAIPTPRSQSYSQTQSTPGGSEQGSLMGTAAAAVGREFGAMIGRLRRVKTEGPQRSLSSGK